MSAPSVRPDAPDAPQAEQAERPARSEAATGRWADFESDRGWVVVDGWVAAAAVAAAVGAWTAPAVPWPVALAVVVAAALARRPAWLVLGVLLVTAVLSQRAWAGLDPAQPGPVQGRAVLVGDPQRLVAATVAVARFDGQRVELWAHGPPAAGLRRALAGQVIVFEGHRQPRPAEAIAADPWRRVVGRIELSRVDGVEPGLWPHRLANEVHRRLAHGARSLPEDDRALLAGLVLGDDREQPPQLRDAFDAVGLSHLLAVSGQNVAFVLAAASPVLLRLRLRARFVAVLTLLAFFATVTRFEPSVLRAVTMAAATATAAALGRPASGLRVLCLAVVGLLAVDPLLVRALGFQLSVAASAGILVLAPAIQRRLPLPPSWGTALAVPLAAQLATAPLLVSRNGSLPLVSLLANVAAVPAAGLVMTWGSSAGLIAGFLPGWAAALLSSPSRVLLGWISWVARRGADLPAVPIGPRALAVGAVLAALLHHRERRHARSMGPTGAVELDRASSAAGVNPRHWALVGAAVVTLALLDPPSAPWRPLPAGAELYRAGGDEVLVVRRPVDGARLLRALRGSIDEPVELLVVASTSSGAWRAATAVDDAYDVEQVLSVDGRAGTGRARPGDRYLVGRLEVELGGPAATSTVATGPLAVLVSGDERRVPP